MYQCNCGARFETDSARLIHRMECAEMLSLEIDSLHAKLDIAMNVMKQNFEVRNERTAYVLTSNGTPMGLSRKREKQVLDAFKLLGIQVGSESSPIKRT